ncbi:proapoptotic nucleolar protein 1-like [Dasypus novemcinctus]|uniref:proapoptotic nucleolar protein 1-like n=1 Tax=Dasypus novemcinctus TaxID=9361 RepID=UPI0039C9E59F
MVGRRCPGLGARGPRRGEARPCGRPGARRRRSGRSACGHGTARAGAGPVQLSGGHSGPRPASSAPGDDQRRRIRTRPRERGELALARPGTPRAPPARGAAPREAPGPGRTQAPARSRVPGARSGPPGGAAPREAPGPGRTQAPARSRVPGARSGPPGGAAAPPEAASPSRRRGRKRAEVASPRRASPRTWRLVTAGPRRRPPRDDAA